MIVTTGKTQAGRCNATQAQQERRRGGFFGIALILAAIFSWASVNTARAQDASGPTLGDVEEFLTDNDWRPFHKTDHLLSALDEPAQEPVTCPDGTRNCAEVGGTYMRDPYYRIQRYVGDEEFDFLMTSDGSLRALLRVERNEDGSLSTKLTVSDRTENGDSREGTIEINSADCRSVGEDACFEVTMNDPATDPDADLLSNLYVWRELKVPPLQAPGFVPPVFGTSKFQEQPPGLLTAQHCFDVTKMDMVNFNDQWQGCSRKIFSELVAGDRDFDFKSFNDKVSYVLPFGWNYVSVPQGTASMHSQLIETEGQLVESESHSTGSKSGLNLGILDFSVTRNRKTQERSEKMYGQKLVYTKQQYLQTHYALVLDKWNAKLNPDFETAIRAAANTLASGQEFDWSNFLSDWGTHYSYATTVGERGYIIDTISDRQIMELHEEGVTTSSGMSAGNSMPLQEFGIPGSAGLSASAENATAVENIRKINTVLNDNQSESVCIGGSSCSGRGASGSPPFAPVLLDLRPLSDLLAPPFFADLENLPAVRKSLASAIADYAFEKEPVTSRPSVQFVRISGLQITRCRWTDIVDTTKFYEGELDDCEYGFEYLKIGSEKIDPDLSPVTLRHLTEKTRHEMSVRADVRFDAYRFLYDSRIDIPAAGSTTACFTAAAANEGKTFQYWGTAQVEVLSAGMLLDPALSIPDKDRGIEDCPIERFFALQE